MAYDWIDRQNIGSDEATSQNIYEKSLNKCEHIGLKSRQNVIGTCL